MQMTGGGSVGRGNRNMASFATVMPANAGIHVFLGRQSRGYPEFTNEVQHQAKVLQWPEITRT
ncbi:MAG: hypothetical protein WBQ75_15495, partial [Acetobacteraceae bacterium]